MSKERHTLATGSGSALALHPCAVLRAQQPIIQETPEPPIGGADVSVIAIELYGARLRAGQC